MTGKLCRSVAVIVLGGLTALVAIAPAYSQNAAPPLTPAPAQGTTVPPMPTVPPITPTAPSSTPPQTPLPPLNIPAGRDFTVPKPIYPQFWLPYTQIQMPEPQYTNGPKLEQMVQNGKLMITLEDAVTLALENNWDIAVQRYNAFIAESDIMRTRAGAAQRGVGSAVTTATAFTDQAAPGNFDPIFSANASVDSKSVLSTGGGGGSAGGGSIGLQNLFTHTEAINFGYTQTFHEGMAITLTDANTRESTTGTSGVNPFVQSNLEAAFNQPLLNGFGVFQNERYIQVALITKKAVDYAFQQSVLTDIVAVENDYWELVYARGNVAVQQEAVTLAQQLYNNNQAQVAVGTLAPLDVVRAEAQLATAQQALILAQTAQQQQQIILMNVISKNPIAPELQNTEVVPTDSTFTPAPMEDIALPTAVAEAIQDRPDVLGFKINLDVDAINIKVTKNALLPSLNVQGFVNLTGLSGNSNVVTVVPGTGTVIDAASTSCASPPCALTVNNLANPGPPVSLILPNTISEVTGVKTGGLPTALAQVFSGKYPEYFAELSFNVPIRNRVAQADSQRAIITERQDQAKYLEEINTTAVDVQNAIITLRQDRASVVAAQKTTELDRETLDADQKRLDVGATTVFVVVTDQSTLETAAAAEVRAEVNLVEAQNNFERALGRVFTAHNITVAEAKIGNAPRDNQIPGTDSSGALIGLREALASLPNAPK